MEPKVIHVAKQRFSSIWIWGLLTVTSVLVAYAVIDQLIAGSKAVHPIDFLLVAVLIVATGGAVYLFYKLQLVVLLHEEGICFKYFLLQKNFRLVTFEEILNYEIKNFDTAEYGNCDENWGVKNHENKVAYLANSKLGIELHMKDGSMVFLSLPDPEAFVKQMRSQLMVH